MDWRQKVKIKEYASPPPGNTRVSAGHTSREVRAQSSEPHACEIKHCGKRATAATSIGGKLRHFCAEHIGPVLAQIRKENPA
jgi:hypothetical protein